MSGRVGAWLVNEGNLVRVNDATPLVVINQLTPINVTFSVPEQSLPDIKSRMAAGKLRVNATIPADTPRIEDGTLSFIDNAVDRQTGTIRLKAVFPNGDRQLWPGQFVNVSIILTTQNDAIVVPSQAVQSGQNGQHVFVVKPDQTVEVRPVVVSRTTEQLAVIAKGLKPGETVVTEGQFLLGSGSRIEVKSRQETVSGTNKAGAGNKGSGQRESAS
jgi:multidrug efflux system membrane fusion protein